MDSAQSYAISAQDFALFVLEFVPPGSSSLCAQAFALSLNSSDLPAHDLEDLVSCPPGSEVLCAQFLDSIDQFFELFAFASLGSGDNPDCAQSLALSLYPAALLSELPASNAAVPAFVADCPAAVCDTIRLKASFDLIGFTHVLGLFTIIQDLSRFYHRKIPLF